jgi:hypothetical protein
VKDPDIKIQLLLGGEKTVNEALGQALELQAVLVAARPHQNNTNTYGGNRSPPSDEKMSNNQGAGAAEKQDTFRVTAPTEEKQRITSDRIEKLDHQETNANGDQITTQKRIETETNCRETSEGRQKGADAGICIKAPTLRTDRHHGKDRH